MRYEIWSGPRRNPFGFNAGGKTRRRVGNRDRDDQSRRVRAGQIPQDRSRHADDRNNPAAPHDRGGLHTRIRIRRRKSEIRNRSNHTDNNHTENQNKSWLEGLE